MKYTKELESQGYVIEFEKDNSDKEGYDLFLKVSKDDDYYEMIYSLSHSTGFYFSFDFTESFGEGEIWDFDNNKLVCEYLGVDQLKEI